MNESKPQTIESVCKELGAVQAFIKLVPKVQNLIAQCDAVDMLLQIQCPETAREELQVLRNEIAQLITGGAQ